MAGDMKLTYFDIYGLGELIRLEFAFAGKPLSEVRVNLEKWSEMKPNVKPLGQLPLLEMNGEVYPQSTAICNYLAREFGLYPKTSLEQMTVDIVMACLQDLVKIQAGWFYLPDGEEKSKLKAEVPASVEKFLTYLDSLLAKNKTGYFVGDSLTLADLAMFDIITGYLTNSITFDPKKYPNIAKNKENVLNNKNIGEYFANRPKHDM